MISFVFYFSSRRIDNLRQTLRFLSRNENLEKNEVVLVCNDSVKEEFYLPDYKLYNLNLEDKNNKIRNLEENEFICKDPILPRTHDYSCKNPNCITHKDTKKKEAVFIKDKDSFKIIYICCVCFYSW